MPAAFHINIVLKLAIFELEPVYISEISCLRCKVFDTLKVSQKVIFNGFHPRYPNVGNLTKRSLLQIKISPLSRKFF